MTANEWNRAHAIGTRVRVRGLKGAADVETVTTTVAWHTSRGRAVVGIKGRRGGADLADVIGAAAPHARWRDDPDRRCRPHHRRHAGRLSAMRETIEHHYTAIEPDGTETRGSVMWPDPPGLLNIRSLVEPLLGASLTRIVHLEHVRVLHAGAYVSMFVDEEGHLKRLPINPKATAIYHATVIEAAGRGHPDAARLVGDGAMPPIVGPAVLFDRNVWR